MANRPIWPWTPSGRWPTSITDHGARAAAEIVETYRVGHEFSKAQQEADADLKK